MYLSIRLETYFFTGKAKKSALISIYLILSLIISFEKFPALSFAYIGQ